MSKVNAMNRFPFHYLHGLTLTIVTTALAFPLARLPYLDKVGPLILALFIGIVVSSILRRQGSLPERYLTGIQFSAKTLLKIGIVFLGLRLNFALVAQLGWKIVLANFIVIALGLLTAEFLGRRLGLSTSLRRTLAVGSSICGATAIAAAIPVLNPENEEVALSITVISILGTLAVLGYLFVAQMLNPSNLLYGSFVGATLQEVAQVVAAGYSFNTEAGDIALVTKLLRVAMLAPVLMIIGLLPNNATEEPTAKRPPMLPWFLAGFIVFGIINSLGILPDVLVNALVQLSLYLTAIAMAAIGMGINVRVLGKFSVKSIAVSLSALVMMILFMLPYSLFVLG